VQHPSRKNPVTGSVPHGSSTPPMTLRSTTVPVSLKNPIVSDNQALCQWAEATVLRAPHGGLMCRFVCIRADVNVLRRVSTQSDCHVGCDFIGRSLSLVEVMVGSPGVNSQHRDVERFFEIRIRGLALKSESQTIHNSPRRHVGRLIDADN
jgi:hypothetical protein